MNRRKLLTLLSVSPLGLLIQNSDGVDRVNAFTETIHQDFFSIVTHYKSEEMMTKSQNRVNCASQLISDASGYIDYAHGVGQFKSSVEDVKKSVRYYLFCGNIPRSEWMHKDRLEKYKSISHEYLCKLNKYESFYNIENSKLGEFLSINYV